AGRRHRRPPRRGRTGRPLAGAGRSLRQTGRGGPRGRPGRPDRGAVPKPVPHAAPGRGAARNGAAAERDRQCRTEPAAAGGRTRAGRRRASLPGGRVPDLYPDSLYEPRTEPTPSRLLAVFSARAFFTFWSDDTLYFPPGGIEAGC